MCILTKVSIFLGFLGNSREKTLILTLGRGNEPLLEERLEPAVVARHVVHDEHVAAGHGRAHDLQVPANAHVD